MLVVGSHCYFDSMEWHVLDALQRGGVRTEFFAARAPFSGSRSLPQKVVGKLLGVMSREPERSYESRLVEAVERTAPAVVLVILGNQVSPKTIDKLRECSKAPIVCWCQDQMTTLGRQFLLGARYDAVFVKDRYLQQLFSRMVRSSSFHYLPEACNPRVHRSLELSSADRERYGCDIMIAGSLYYYRQELLQALDEFELRIWGHAPDWLLYRLRTSHMGREVHGDEKVRAARAAAIAINTLHFAEVDGLNCRAFELAGCGAFQLCTSRPVLAEHFRPGVEIETFDSAAELVDKARYYLGNPQQAAQIAARGQQRAHREHTYEHRLDEIFRRAAG